MSAVLQRIASLASSLAQSELRVLLDLSVRAESSDAHVITASSRDLARTTGLARASVQTAIDSLNARGLIESDSGSATRSASHRLLCFPKQIEESGLAAEPEVGQLPGHRGPNAAPQVAQSLSQTGPITRPGVAQSIGEGGLIAEPPLNMNSATCENRSKERVSTRADSIDSEFYKTIDRLQKAKKGDFDEDVFELARRQIASHHAKFARPENRLPSSPDDTITARFLAVAEWPKLEPMLVDLASERKEAGHSYGWYVTVALQRIHGISPDQLRQVRTQSKASMAGHTNPAGLLRSAP